MKQHTGETGRDQSYRQSGTLQSSARRTGKATGKLITGTMRGITKSRKQGMSTTTNEHIEYTEYFIDPETNIKQDVTPKPLIPDEVKPTIKEETRADQSESKPKESTVEVTESKGVSDPMISFSMRSVEQSESLSEFSDDAAQRDEVEKKEERKEEDPVISEAELDADVDINLTETKTMDIFILPGRAVSIESEHKAKIDKLNLEYKDLLKKKVASDGYSNRPIQTNPVTTKFKEIQTNTVKKNDAEHQVTEWILHDTYGVEQLESHEVIAKEFDKDVDKAMIENIKTPGCLLNAESFISQTVISSSMSQSQRTGDKIGNSSRNISRSNRKIEQSSRSIQSSTNRSVSESKRSNTSSALADAEATPFKAAEDVNLPNSIVDQFKIVERILTQNRYLEEQILYRNYPKITFPKREEENVEDDKAKGATAFNFMAMQSSSPSKKEEEEEEEEQEEVDSDEPNISPLFNFSCPESKGRIVSNADWNTFNQDLLAVSYGEYDHLTKKEGLLMFWTLKSPSFPERIIRAPTGIVSCQFSKRNPNLIATGSYDGVVAIYDLRRKEDTPVQESSKITGKHIDTVWETQWVDRGAEKGEFLVSISSDGRIIEWSMKKGLEHRDLLTIKKPTNPNQKDDKESTVFRQASGFTLDFPLGESLLYLVGTEEGTIHKCSVSYNDDLDTYWGHSGPVYRVRTSPFWPHIMLSCSADWTVMVWNWKRDEGIAIQCDSNDLTDAVSDIQWSPYSSTVFASVADDGRCEIWDLAVKNFEPIIINRGTPGVKRTMVRFNKFFPVLVTGNVDGDVEVFRVQNMEPRQMTTEEQKKNLEEVVYPAGKGRGGNEDADEDEINAE